MLRITSLLGCLLLLTISLGVPSAWAVNKVLSLDGDGDYVGIEKKLLDDLAEFTIEVWINPGILTTTRVGLIGQNDAVEFGFIEPNILEIFTASTGQFQTQYDYPRKEWHHVVAVGSTTFLRIYIDGKVAAETSIDVVTYGSSDYNVNIGGGGVFNPSDNWYTGLIDEVRIWHIARTQEEIQDAMYRTLTADEINSGNLVGYWNFDDGTADDLSPYGNHGTLMGDAEILASDAPFTGTINGTVTDVDSNPIKLAFVIAINAETKDKYKAFTDGNGDYEILDLPPGTYWVICIKKGYKAGIKKAEVVAGEATRVDFMLIPKLE